MARLLLLLVLSQVPAGIQAQSGVVTGILRTDTGLPLEGVRVAVSPANSAIADTLLESLGLTDNTGRYRLENVSPGRYYILFGRGRGLKYHPGLAELNGATIIQVVAGSTVDVPDMVIAGNHLTGRVVDLATGKPRRIENLVLCCEYSPLVPQGAFTAKVSDDGGFIFTAVPQGNYALTTVDPTVIPIGWAVTVGDKSVPDLRLEVSQGVTVDGTVVDQTGEPVTAFVRLRPKSTNSVFNVTPSTNAVRRGGLVVPKDYSPDGVKDLLFKSAKVHETLGPSDGRFAFQKVYPGAYVLEITTSGALLLERDLDIGSAGLTNVALQVPAIRVTGRVVTPGNSMLPKLGYIRLVRSDVDASPVYGFPDTEGHFSFLLVPGRYRVFTDRLGSSVQSVSDGSRDITNTEYIVEGLPNQQIVVTLER